MPRPRIFHNRRRYGFTVVELMIGMTITSMVLAALAAFTMSVAAAWKANEAQADAMTMANIATARMGSILRGVRAAGVAREGSFTETTNPAAIVLWMSDTNNDASIQLSELEMLAYDPAGKRICRYRPISLASDQTVTTAEFADLAMISRIASAFTRIPLAARIEGMRVYKSDPGDRAGVVEAQMRVRNGGSVQSFSVVQVLRSGVSDPN